MNRRRTARVVRKLINVIMFPFVLPLLSGVTFILICNIPSVQTYLLYIIVTAPMIRKHLGCDIYQSGLAMVSMWVGCIITALFIFASGISLHETTGGFSIDHVQYDFMRQIFYYSLILQVTRIIYLFCFGGDDE
jgi:hypothetical protein